MAHGNALTDGEYRELMRFVLEMVPDRKKLNPQRVRDVLGERGRFAESLKLADVVNHYECSDFRIRELVQSAGCRLRNSNAKDDDLPNDRNHGSCSIRLLQSPRELHWGDVIDHLLPPLDLKMGDLQDLVDYINRNEPQCDTPYLNIYAVLADRGYNLLDVSYRVDNDGTKTIFTSRHEKHSTAYSPVDRHFLLVREKTDTVGSDLAALLSHHFPNSQTISSLDWDTKRFDEYGQGIGYEGTVIPTQNGGHIFILRRTTFAGSVTFHAMRFDEEGIVKGRAHLAGDNAWRDSEILTASCSFSGQ